MRDAKTSLKPHLPCRGIEQIDATYNGVNPLFGIINHYRQLIGVLPIGSQQHEITHLALKVLCVPPLHPIDKLDNPVRNTQAPGPGSCPWRQAVPATPGIEQPAIHGVLGGTRRNGATRAGARIDLTFRLQTHQDTVVKIQPLALPYHRPIPLEAQRIERGQDGQLGPWHRTRRINILDSEQPFAALSASIKITAHGGNQGTEMQGTGGRRRETAPIAAFGNLSSHR